jgi:hypothetical protein
VRNKNVISLPATESFTPELALKSALDLEMSDVLCIGYLEDELVVRSSRMSRADALFLLEKAKLWTLEGGL